MADSLAYETHDYRLFIDGKWQAAASGEMIELVNPADEEVIGRVASAGDREVDMAIESARRGLARWKATSSADRAGVIARAADILRAKQERAAIAMTREQGKTLDESRGELTRAIETIQWTAGQAETDFARLYEDAALRRTTRPVPVGVVAAFAPWNYPAVICARKVAPALAAGCAVILKAAEETPAAAVALVEAFDEAGLPDGVLNLLFGQPAHISGRLIASPVVRKLTFTGSTAVGKLLARKAIDNLIPCVLELGGHCPVIIDETVDIPAVARAVADYKFECAGQSCNAPSRVYVQQDIADKFADELVKIADSLQVGDGLDPKTTMGPLANRRRLEAMERLTADAVGRGARVLTGGRRVGETGYFWAPTILTDVPANAQVMQEEPFGPLLPVIPYATLEDAFTMANASNYGLAGYGFSAAPEIQQRMADELDMGYVGINILSGVPEHAPISGIRDSGYGVEGGLEGIAAYLHQKLVTENRG